MIIIEEIDGGYRVSVPCNRWTWWAYPETGDLRNNGPRYQLRGEQVSPRITLPMNWTLGDVIDAVSKKTPKALNERFKLAEKDTQ